MSRSLNLVSGLYLKISILTIVAGLVLRIVLLFNGQTSDLGFSPGEWCQVFLLGAVNDLCAATIGFGFLWLFMMSLYPGQQWRAAAHTGTHAKEPPVSGRGKREVSGLV